MGTRTGRRHHRRRLFLTILLLGTGAGTARAQGLIATFASADTAEHQRRFGDATRLYERAYGESGFDPVCMALAAGSIGLVPAAHAANDTARFNGRWITSFPYNGQTVTMVSVYEGSGYKNYVLVPNGAVHIGMGRRTECRRLGLF